MFICLKISVRMDASNEQGLRCPKQECRKLFRKENLLMVTLNTFLQFSTINKFTVTIYYLYLRCTLNTIIPSTLTYWYLLQM